jgi:acetyl esterase/lipase
MKAITSTLATILMLFCTDQAFAADPNPVMIGGNFEVEAIRDIRYYEGKDADLRKHKLDLFVPKGQKDFPVLFFIHGGAWTTGDKAMYSRVGTVFAKNGIGTVVISYRLTPAVQHPGHIEDVAKAFAWTNKNIAKYGGKPDQIFVTGQSAGGHLAALLATNDAYLKAQNLSLKDIKGAIPISGIYTFTPGRMDRIIGKGEEAAASASPIKHVAGNEPPFLILYAKNDFPGCAKMSLDFCKTLKDKKIEAETKEIDDRNHVTIVLWLMLSEADPTTQAMLQFIAKHSDLKLKQREEKKEK